MCRVSKVVDLTEDRPVLVVEPALPWPVLAIGMSEVPLAHNSGLVTRLLQGLGQKPLVGGQAVLTGRGNHRSLQAVAKGIAAGHQGGARRRAHWLGVELIEPGPFLCEPVNVL